MEPLSLSFEILNGSVFCYRGIDYSAILRCMAGIAERVASGEHAGGVGIAAYISLPKQNISYRGEEKNDRTTSNNVEAYH